MSKMVRTNRDWHYAAAVRTSFSNIFLYFSCLHVSVIKEMCGGLAQHGAGDDHFEMPNIVHLVLETELRQWNILTPEAIRLNSLLLRRGLKHLSQPNKLTLNYYYYKLQ